MDKEFVKKELNPVNDLERFVIHYRRSQDFDVSIKRFLLNNIELLGEYTVGAIKSAARGGTLGTIIGGVTGTVSSIITGNDIGEGTLYGFRQGLLLGAAIDFTQYAARSMYHVFVSAIKNMR